MMPEKITMPIAARVSAPAPKDSMSGMAPAAVVMAVMRMGRRRVAEAWMMASIFDRPLSWRWLANSTMRMPFLETSPTSVMRPTWL